MERYLLLDRDGVICVRQDAPIKTANDFLFLPHVFEALEILAREEYKVIVLHNQEGGELDPEITNEILEKMNALIEENNGSILDVLVCSKPGSEDWFPQPGLLRKAAGKHGFELSRTFFIGARLECIQAGWAAGCRTAFVRSGKPFKTVQALQKSERQPDLNTRDLFSLVHQIIKESSSR